MNFYFGIDGGGTKSRITLSTDKGLIIKSIEGDSTNPFAVGFDKACTNATKLIVTALEAAGRKKEDQVFGCIGSAGLGRVNDIAHFEEKLKSLLPYVHTFITNDARILLEGALDGNDGMILISGTGSVCMGKTKGQIIKTGGFGWRLGDEGSGWWLSKEAIKRCLKSKEKRDLKTDMTEDLISFFHMNNVFSFISYINDDKTEKGIVAKASSIVLAHAEKKDPLAQSIVEEGAEELFALVETTYKKIGMGNKKLVLYGGVMENNHYYRSIVETLISNRLPDIEILRSPIHSSLEGALSLAKSTFF